MTENSELVRLKSEPLKREFINILISDNGFVSGINDMGKRAVETAAEGGLIVYKKVGFNKPVVYKKYGLSNIRDSEDMFLIQDNQGAHVSMGDPNERQSRRLRLTRNQFVRIGQLHFHPNASARMSDPDIDNYSDTVFGRNTNSSFISSKEMFNIVCHVSRKQMKLTIFGVSLPAGVAVTNEYQSLGDRDSVEYQNEVFAKSGFRTILFNIDVDIKKIHLTRSDLTELVNLGG